MRFEELGLRSEIMRGIEDAGFIECTPVQELALPWTLEGRDVAAQAQTGTGKTACFLLTAFTRLLESNKQARPGHPRAVCLAPTRELAVQIADDAAVLGRHTGLDVTTIYGGVSFDKQRYHIERGIDLCIATPGRLMDYMRRREIRLDRAEIAIVDEADRMFDMGFIQDLRYIMNAVPPKDRRQTLMFSATLSYRVSEFGYQFMNDPKEITIEPENVVVEKIDQRIYHVGQDEKFELLLGFIDDDDPDCAIVFCNRKITCEEVAFRLRGNDVAAEALIGDMPQRKREKVLEQFRDGKITVLVATDVASRGIHVDDVSHVFNYDVPQDPEDYVHRIGRTGRMGAAGSAITLACEEYVLQLPAVESYIGDKIAVGTLSDDMFAIDEGPPVPRRRRRGRPGGRGGPGRGGGGRHGGGGGGRRGGGRRGGGRGGRR